MNLERSLLPGVGTLYTVTTYRSQRLAVVWHRDGRRDLVFYDGDDAAGAADTLVLEPSEARQVADLLSAVVTVDHMADLERGLSGVAAVRLRLPAGSALAGSPVSDIHARTRAAVTIAAVVREHRVMVPVGTEFVLAAGDDLVAMGTDEGVAALADLLCTDQAKS